jgi:hypothetical protein
MAVQLLKSLGPSLAPVLEANDAQATAAAAPAEGDSTQARSPATVDTTPAF